MLGLRVNVWVSLIVFLLGVALYVGFGRRSRPLPAPGEITEITEITDGPGSGAPSDEEGDNGGDDDAVDWTFARQRLTDGVSAPVGHGALQACPAPDRTSVLGGAR